LEMVLFVSKFIVYLNIMHLNLMWNI